VQRVCWALGRILVLRLCLFTGWLLCSCYFVLWVCVVVSSLFVLVGKSLCVLGWGLWVRSVVRCVQCGVLLRVLRGLEGWVSG